MGMGMGMCARSITDPRYMYIHLYLCRGDLQRILHKLRRENCRSVAEEKIWQIFVQVTLGLYHLHSRQILHRYACV